MDGGTFESLQLLLDDPVMRSVSLMSVSLPKKAVQAYVHRFSDPGKVYDGYVIAEGGFYPPRRVFERCLS